MKRTVKRLALLVLALPLASCSSNFLSTPAPIINKGVLLDANLTSSNAGWEGEATDYGIAQQDLIEFSFSYAPLPAPLDTTKKALRVSGRNRSDDLFMFVRKQLTGLAPNTDYTLDFDVELASPHPAGSIGIGGSPATSVFLKAGASAAKPEKTLKDDFYTLNVDKGSQSEAGTQAVLLGNLANGKETEEYTLIQRSNEGQPLKARTNDKGELWIFVGTDSGFEGDQTLYYSRIKVTAL